MRRLRVHLRGTQPRPPEVVTEEHGVPEDLYKWHSGQPSAAPHRLHSLATTASTKLRATPTRTRTVGGSPSELNHLNNDNETYVFIIQTQFASGKFGSPLRIKTHYKDDAKVEGC